VTTVRGAEEEVREEVDNIKGGEYKIVKVLYFYLDKERINFYLEGICLEKGGYRKIEKKGGEKGGGLSSLYCFYCFYCLEFQ
jgi:hypothetical protein